MNISQVMASSQILRSTPRPYSIGHYYKYVDLTGKFLMISGRHPLINREDLCALLRNLGCKTVGDALAKSRTSSNTVLILIDPASAGTEKVKQALTKKIPILRSAHLERFFYIKRVPNHTRYRENSLSWMMYRDLSQLGSRVIDLS